MWIFPINMEGFAGENLGSSLFHLYSCEFSLELFLFSSLSGQGPDSGSYSISFAPCGSQVQWAESHMTPGHVSVSHWRCCVPSNSSRPWPAQTPMIMFLSCLQGKIWQALPREMCTQNIFSGWMEVKPLLPPLSISFRLFCLFISDFFLDHFPQFFLFSFILNIYICPLEWSRHPSGGKHTIALYFLSFVKKTIPF